MHRRDDVGDEPTRWLVEQDDFSAANNNVVKNGVCTETSSRLETKTKAMHAGDVLISPYRCVLLHVYCVYCVYCYTSAFCIHACRLISYTFSVSFGFWLRRFLHLFLLHSPSSMNKLFTGYLSKYTNSHLNSLLVACGIPTPSKKIDKINALISYLPVYQKHPVPTICSIDIGIKNFSYCKSKAFNVIAWDCLNLNQYKFDPPVHGDSSSLINSKFLLSSYSNLIVNEFVTKDNAPHIITVENQRTRTMGNSSTLPTVLLNYTLENMLYSLLYSKSKDYLIIPLNSRNMVNFWINRFLDKLKVKFLNPLSKKLRIQLLLSNYNQFFTYDKISLPSDYSSLSMQKKAKFVQSEFNLALGHQVDKLDDLTDSLLYNTMVQLFINNQKQLLHYIENDLDLIHLLHDWNAFHIDLLRTVVSDNDLIFDEKYLPFL